MKKTLLLLFLTFVCTAQSFASIIVYPGKENQTLIPGGPEGKNYAAIFTKGASSKVEAIKQVSDFLVKYKLVETTESLKKYMVEFDESQSEFNVPVNIRVGFHTAKPFMGVAGTFNPMILKADMRIQFYEDGTVRMVIDNLVDYAYCTKCKIFKSAPNAFEYTDYLGFYNTAYTSKGLGKGILLILRGVANAKQINAEFDEFFSKIDSHFNVMKSHPSLFELVTAEEEVALNKKALEDKDTYQPENAVIAQVESAEKAIAEGRMVNVSEYTWRTDVKTIFDHLIVGFNQFFGGEVKAIAEDGDVTWEQVDGKLLPVDAKLRKSLQKSGDDYFSYQYYK